AHRPLVSLDLVRRVTAQAHILGACDTGGHETTVRRSAARADPFGGDFGGEGGHRVVRIWRARRTSASVSSLPFPASTWRTARSASAIPYPRRSSALRAASAPSGTLTDGASAKSSTFSPNSSARRSAVFYRSRLRTTAARCFSHGAPVRHARRRAPRGLPCR